MNNELEDELGKILKPLTDGGYHNNSDDKTRSTCYDCKRIDEALAKLTKLISKREIEARIDERNTILTDLEDFKQEVLESRGIPNPTYIGKKELQEWIDDRKSAQLTELQEGKNNE